MKRKTLVIFSLLCILLVFSFVLANFAGRSGISLNKTIYYLLHPFSSGMERDIIWQIRFPRVVLGVLVGAALASCGVVFQGLLRNPLAESYTLGTSGGAAFGASLAVVLKLSGTYMPVFAFAGSLMSIFLVYGIASRKQFSNSTLILGGVVLSYLFSSLVLLIFSLSKAEEVHGVILWLMGDLSSAAISVIKVAPFFIIPSIIVFFIFSRDLNILTLGEDKAAHLGVNNEKVRKILFVASSCMAGACVAAAGVIGFVGLIVPHFVRRIVGVDHRLVLPASCLVGAIFLILCDVVARNIIYPLELPVGVITGIFGGIFFLSFLWKTGRWRIF
ncbi:MAG: iron ABC transporter permease [Candidatus Omnitrophota bacterium]|nr:iron ABC transporter permease [Candidatus Omnitrophota bacterium]